MTKITENRSGKLNSRGVFLKQLKISGILFLLLTGSIQATEKRDTLSVRLKKLEATTEGRLGVFATDVNSNHSVVYRGYEIFPTGCTSKVMGVAAVLAKSVEKPALLDKRIRFSKEDLVNWNPVTERYLGEGMTVRELSAAAVSYSDNTAMNLLLKEIGGVEGMNRFARSLGDLSFQQDNDWPAEAMSGGKGNRRDSSTPFAMVRSLQKLIFGSALPSAQQSQLIQWMRETKTGANRIRSSVPVGWKVGNKTGTGGAWGTTNDLAILWPPEQGPIILGVFYSSEQLKSPVREDVISGAARIVIEEWDLNRFGN